MHCAEWCREQRAGSREQRAEWKRVERRAQSSADEQDGRTDRMGKMDKMDKMDKTDKTDWMTTGA